MPHKKRNGYLAMSAAPCTHQPSCVAYNQMVKCCSQSLMLKYSPLTRCEGFASLAAARPPCVHAHLLMFLLIACFGPVSQHSSNQTAVSCAELIPWCGQDCDDGISIALSSPGRKPLIVSLPDHLNSPTEAPRFFETHHWFPCPEHDLINLSGQGEGLANSSASIQAY